MTSQVTVICCLSVFLIPLLASLAFWAYDENKVAMQDSTVSSVKDQTQAIIS